MRGIVLLFVVVGSVTAQTWNFKISTPSTVLGNALTSNPLNSNIIYGAPGGRQLYISRDRGYNWQSYGNLVPPSGSGDNIIKSIAVSPLDTLQILVGVEASGAGADRVMKSTDGGVSWTETWSGAFSYYGKPVEFKPEHPDTVYTMSDTTLWRSTNFGSTWTLVRSTNGLFSAWCDGELRSDSANIMYIGDFATGLWKTANYGATWKLVYGTTGEIPSIAIDPFNQRVAYATKYSGGGGVIRTTDWGETWHSLPTPLGNGPAWWITCSKVSRGYVYFGVYGADTTNACIFVSADSGASWRRMKKGFSTLGQINYGLLALDTLTVIASQYNGIWKLQYPTVIKVTSPNGGESWQAGTLHNITWVDTAVYGVKIEFSTNNGSSWTLIADSIAPGESTYAWTVPTLSSASCRIRVSDVYFTTTRDTSDAAFTLFVDPLTLFSPLGGENWDSYSKHTISWIAHNIDTMKLEYSIDSGATWNFITRIPASQSSYNWSIPHTPSTRCKIRISNYSDTSVFRTSPALFTISAVASYSALLHIRDNGVGKDSLTFGATGGATDSVDIGFGEAALPPPPSPGLFDVRCKFPTGDESKIDIRDTLGGSHHENLYRMRFQPGAGGYPITFSWRCESLRSGTYILRDTLTHGNLYNIDMRVDSALVVSDSTIHVLEVIECEPVTISYPSDGNWVLLSLPVDVGDRRRSSLFPYSISKAFAYSGGYFTKDTLTPGIGYWLKTDAVQIIGRAREKDTFSVAAGWNIVGSISTPVSLSSLVVEPDTLLSSSFFGYASGYYTADSILPGNGYWIKTKVPGKIFISQTFTASSKTHQHVSDFFRHDALTFRDGFGHAQTLFVGSELEGVNLSLFEMPPPPPDGGFDVRFGSQRIVESIPQNLQKPVTLPILVRAPSNKIFFSWGVDNEKKFTYILVEKDRNREVDQIRLVGTGSRVIEKTDRTTFALNVQQIIGSAETPREYSLGEMYPNPFNPTTRFSFTVPSDAHVTIRVYSILGEIVATLIDEVEHVGVHQVSWNATNSRGVTVSSGVYYIRMDATPVTSSNENTISKFHRVVLLK
jgi:hypothetical protein